MARWLVLLALVVACRGALDRPQLRGAVDDLAGLGAEAELLVALALDGETTRAYHDVQRDAILARVVEARGRLGRGVRDDALAIPSESAQALGLALEDGIRADARDQIADATRRLRTLATELGP